MIPVAAIRTGKQHSADARGFVTPARPPVLVLSLPWTRSSLSPDLPRIHHHARMSAQSTPKATTTQPQPSLEMCELPVPITIYRTPILMASYPSDRLHERGRHLLKAGVLSPRSRSYPRRRSCQGRCRALNYQRTHPPSFVTTGLLPHCGQVLHLLRYALPIPFVRLALTYDRPQKSARCVPPDPCASPSVDRSLPSTAANAARTSSAARARSAVERERQTSYL